MFDDIYLLLGSGFEDYPILVSVITIIVFVVLLNTTFSLIRDVLERVAGFR